MKGRSFIGSLVIEDDCVIEIIEGNEVPRGMFDEIVNATGVLLFYQALLTTMSTFVNPA